MEIMQSGTDETRSARRSGGWAFPVLLAIVFLALVSVAQWAPKPTVPPPSLAAAWAPQPTGQTVSLEIDFGNGAKKTFAALPWEEGMTVGEVMELARRFGPGIVFSQIGEGERGFLGSLDGVANQGAGGRNWIYRVDDRHAHGSFCLEKLEVGGRVLWTFGDERYNGGEP